MEIEKSIEPNQNKSNNGSNKNLKNNETSKVQVALRVRPFVPKEIIENEAKCVTCYLQTNQVIKIFCRLKILEILNTYCHSLNPKI